MEIGAHVSSSGSIDKCLDRACEIGAEAIQLFASAPQSWRPSSHRDEATQAFRDRAAECGMNNVFLHGIYLINLAAEKPDHLARSVQSLQAALRDSSSIGGRGVIFHIGSHKGAGFEAAIDQVVASMVAVLNDTPADSWLIVENSAGMGGSIGSKFAEIGAVLRAVGSARVKVCLDTCHMLAAGYEIRFPDALDRTLDEFDQEVGLDKLVAIHANDSKVDLGGGLDRHENIGEGHIGLAGFETLFRHSAFKDLPLLLEVPGFDHKGPDRRNVELLAELRDRLGLAKPPLSSVAPTA